MFEREGDPGTAGYSGVFQGQSLLGFYIFIVCFSCTTHFMDLVYVWERRRPRHCWLLRSIPGTKFAGILYFYCLF